MQTGRSYCGPDREEQMTSASVDEGRDSWLSPTDAATHVARHALRRGRVGRVGIELEAHVVDMANPNRRVPWPTLQAVVARPPVLPRLQERI